MTLVDLDMTLTLQETEFPDLLPEPAKKNKKRAVLPPTDSEFHDANNDDTSVSTESVAEVYLDTDAEDDDEDLLLDELLDDASMQGVSPPRHHYQSHHDYHAAPQKPAATTSLNDTLTTDSDRNDGFSSDDSYNNAQEDAPEQQSVVVLHNMESIAGNDLKKQKEPSVVVLHDLDDTEETTVSQCSDYALSDYAEVEKAPHSQNTFSNDNQEGFSSTEEHEVVQVMCDERFMEEEEEEDQDYDSAANADDDSSEGTASLLGHAKDRIAMQHLYDEISELETIIENKNEEIENLSCQLRRAVATKCDLVIAHTELERHHEFNLACQETHVDQLKKEKCSIEDHKSQVERELLNELVKVTDELHEARKSHRQELEDWERLHRNEMLEKDFEIAQLSEDLRKLKMESSSGSKKSGLKVLFRQ